MNVSMYVCVKKSVNIRVVVCVNFFIYVCIYVCMHVCLRDRI